MVAGELRDAIMMATMGLWKGVWAKVFAFIPNLIATTLILVLGYLVSRAVEKLGAAILKRLGLDRLGSRVGADKMLNRAGMGATPSEIIGHVIFWLLMLTFVLSATETLGLANVAQTVGAFVRYLPNVIAAAVVFVIGLTLAQFAREFVRGGTEGLHLDYARPLGTLVYGLIVIVAGSLAVAQLQIETGFFNRLVEIVLLATGLAVALGLGLGGRSIAAHVVAGLYLRDYVKSGMEVSVEDNRGSVQQVGTVATRVRTRDGRTMYIPNGRLVETVICAGGTASET